MSPWERIIYECQFARMGFVIVLVCGGRDYDDEVVFDHLMDAMLAEFCEVHPDTTLVIVHGGARGVDTLADRWAKRNGITVVPCPADWGTHGKAAGMIRNAEMLKKWKPSAVIAFPGGRGTAHMVSIARKAGVSVCEVKV